jgi:hypothetical protein
MAVKTIEYAFPLSSGSVTSATARDFTSITIYIPESALTFRSVTLEMGGSNSAGVTSITAILMGISLGAVARSDNTVTQTIANSGEDFSFLVTRDVTSYFSTNWTGTNMTAGARLTVTGVATVVCSAKLIITYDYSTLSTTRVKTVRIPIDGNTGALTTSLANVGGLSNQIPNLSTFLPESSVVIRDLFFETYAHTGRAGSVTTDRALNLRFDGVNTLSATYEGGSLTDYSIKRIDKSITLFSSGATGNVEASTANVDMPFTCLGGIIYVTYEYDHTNSTTILNSLILPVVDVHGWVGGTTTTQANIFTLNLEINETTPTLVQSGILFSYTDSGAVSVNLRVGDQNDKIFINPATVRSGSMYSTRRFDDGSNSGTQAGIILSQGPNQIVFSVNTTGTTLGSYGSNLTGTAYLNYTSDKYSLGDNYHNTTTIWDYIPYYVSTGAREFKTPVSQILLSQNAGGTTYINNVGLMAYLMTTSTPTSTIPINFEFVDNGYVSFYDSMYITDDEIGTSIMWGEYTAIFNNGYIADNRLQIGTVYDILISNAPNVCYFQMSQIVTSTAIVYTYSGTVSGANSESISINLWDSLTGENLGNALTIGDGIFEISYPKKLTAFATGQYGASSFYVSSGFYEVNPAISYNLNFSFAEFGYGVA